MIRPLLFTIVLASAALQAAPPKSHLYRVTIDEAGTKARVEATLHLPSTSLAMFGVAPSKALPNGQADFIDKLSITDLKGNAIPFKDLGEGEWELSRSGTVKLRYEVRLEHDQHEWPAGVEEVSYRTADGLMITGYALLIAPGDNSEIPYTVELKLPKGWKAITPWRGEKLNNFSVPTRRELLSNAMFLGTAHVESVSIDGVELDLVLGRCCADDAKLFIDFLRPQLSSYLELFGGKPRSSRYLIIVNGGASGDGGAFSGSFSQFIRGDADEKSRVIWGHVMAHELLHFWNGLSLAPADSREEWFKEGVTDYLTITTLSKNGLISGDVLQNRIESMNRRYVLGRLMGGEVTVREAGEKKQEHRLLVYGGGAVTAFALDVELRSATGNAKGLGELMRSLFVEFGSGKPYTLDDVKRHAEEIAGRQLDELFEKSVESKGMFDIEPYLKRAGLRLDHFYEEQFVSTDATATDQQRAIYRAIFGNVSF